MRRHPLIRTAVAAALLALAGGAAGPALAQAWPARPITLIIPFPSGGTLDAVGRLLAHQLGQQLGQKVIVDHRPGGAGSIGAGIVARAPADGYMLLLSTSAFTTTPMMRKKPPYDVVRDFAPLALVAKAPLAIAVTRNLPFNDVRGLLAYAKAHPGKLSFAISATGSAGHLGTELLRRMGAMAYMTVPYNGAATAFHDLVGGTIDAFIDPIAGSATFARAGQLKLLAVSSKARLPDRPDLPTVAETVPGYEFYLWYGLWGPAGLPREIATRLNAEVNKALASDLRGQLGQQGLLPTPGSIEDFAKFQKDDMALSQRIITEAKIGAE